LQEKIYKIPEVAEMLRVKDYTVREWLRTGQIGGFKAGRVWRIRQADVDEFIRKGGAPE